MKISNESSKLIFILIIIIKISIFFIPELILIYNSKQKIIQMKSLIDNYDFQKMQFKQNLEESKNLSEILQKNIKEELVKLKELIKINDYYEDANNEEKTDSYLTERRNDEMYSLIKLYENNKESTNDLINNLKNYFKNHTLEDYYNNISNILLTSTIIKNEDDINFIYEKIIKPFYSDIKDKKNKKYILKYPCFKVSLDTNNPYEFHKKCNNSGDTIMLIKTNKTRFGGITELPWGKLFPKIKDFRSTKTKLFNLDNQKIFIYNKNQEVSRYIPPIRAENHYFAIFGYNDIYLGFLPWESSSSFPKQFLKENNTNKYFNDLLNQKIDNPSLDEINFEYLDIEVYQIISINGTR